MSQRKMSEECNIITSASAHTVEVFRYKIHTCFARHHLPFQPSNKQDKITIGNKFPQLYTGFILAYHKPCLSPQIHSQGSPVPSQNSRGAEPVPKSCHMYEAKQRYKRGNRGSMDTAAKAPFSRSTNHSGFSFQKSRG